MFFDFLNELIVLFVSVGINHTNHFISDLLFKILIYLIQESWAKHGLNKSINIKVHFIFRLKIERRSFFLLRFLLVFLFIELNQKSKYGPGVEKVKMFLIVLRLGLTYSFGNRLFQFYWFNFRFDHAKSFIFRYNIFLSLQDFSSISSFLIFWQILYFFIRFKRLNFYNVIIFMGRAFIVSAVGTRCAQFSLRWSVIRIIRIFIIQNRIIFNIINYVFHLLFRHFQIWWVWAHLHIRAFSRLDLSLREENFSLRVIYLFDFFRNIFIFITIIILYWCNFGHIILTRERHFNNRVLKTLHWV
jgi:hypothetical protein